MKKKRLSNYTLDQSPLYKLKNKRKLASILKLTLKELNTLLDEGKHKRYKCFMKIQGDKKRPIQAPKGKMKYIHQKLFQFLRRISPPKYLYSGVPERTYILNAEQHKANPVLYKLDIEKFYPSTKGWHIFKFFFHVMQCSKDVAALLTRICTVDDFLPTGSPLSQTLAFHAHHEMFEKLNKLSVDYSLTMTCYVDDIAFSGKNIPSEFRYKAKKIITSSGLKVHPKKEFLSWGNRPRVLTGVVITNNKLLLPNTQHFKLTNSIKEYLQANPNEKGFDTLRKKVLGRLVSASQIEIKFINKRKALMSK